jgi:hypothetical protein
MCVGGGGAGVRRGRCWELRALESTESGSSLCYVTHSWMALAENLTQVPTRQVVTVRPHCTSALKVKAAPAGGALAEDKGPSFPSSHLLCTFESEYRIIHESTGPALCREDRGQA